MSFRICCFSGISILRYVIESSLPHKEPYLAYLTLHTPFCPPAPQNQAQTQIPGGDPVSGVCPAGLWWDTLLLIASTLNF